MLRLGLRLRVQVRELPATSPGCTDVVINRIDPVTLREFEHALGRLPRVSLASLPTPLEYAARLSQQLGSEVFLKRDDLTGLALGGNKLRMFEFLFGEIERSGFDTVVAGAVIPSNFPRLLAGACAKRGLGCHLVFPHDALRDGGHHHEVMVSLPRLLGANVRLVDGYWETVVAEMDNLVEQLTAQGRSVYAAKVPDRPRARIVSPLLGLHAVGNAQMFVELLRQLADRAIHMDGLWVCSSDATQAGLALANKHLGNVCRVTGVSPMRAGQQKGGWATDIAAIANEAATILGLDTTIKPDELENISEYETDDDGQTSRDAIVALRCLAELEGIFLDPVYTGKAMAALIDRSRESERGEKPDSVVFVHTGGIPALFGYQAEIMALIA